MFFQIHKDGQAIDGSSYSTLEEASSILIKAEEGGIVAEVDNSDKIYAAIRFRSAGKLRVGFGREYKVRSHLSRLAFHDNETLRTYLDGL